jgi:recombination protein RecT
MKQIKSVIASNLTPEKMARISLNELRNNDFLAKIAIQNPESFVNSVVQAAHLGLEIGGVLGQAYLAPYKGEIKMMPGYRGLISLARRSGEITSINAEIVYQNDTFDLVLGIAPEVTHKPMLDGPRGEPKLAYMVANFKDGGHHFEWMTMEEIMSIKARSAAVQSGKKTPWDTDRDEMIRKTVIRRGWKYLPMSIEMQTAQLIESANEQGKSVVIDGDSVLVQDDPNAPAIDGTGSGNTLPTCSPESFTKKSPGWKTQVEAGKPVNDLIAMIETRELLTAEQKMEIAGWPVRDAPTEGVSNAHS